mmetsp:Transcript_90675/g.256035  ORF Transcript_90675/g.256035 Transcript_90675/m.256035 type:complete len:435 (+) Transcript_90675:133-1437(+)
MSAKGGKSNSVDFGYLNDKKLEKGKKKVLEQAAGWKGGSHQERKEAHRENVKALKHRQSNRHSEKISWKKKAIGIAAVLFIGGVGVFNFLSTILGFVMGSGMTVIDVKNTAQLKSALFSGDPWFIFCVNNETVNHRLPQLLEDSTRDISRRLGIRVGLLHCWEPTESGRSVAQKFKLKTSPPLAFVVANGNNPRVVNLLGTSKVEDLEKKIKPALKVDVSAIDSLKKWPSLCTSRRTCIVVGHKQHAQRDTALNLLRPLVEKYRTARFVTLDTAFWKLKLDDGVLKRRPTKEGETQKGADVLCFAREGEGKATYSGNFLQQLSSSAMAEFVEACQKRVDLVPISILPKISARPSKPKKVVAPPVMRTPPRPTPRPTPREARANVDHVGSRAAMEQQEQEEALFEAIDEFEQAEEGEESGEDDEVESEDDDEVEL